jgi:hypothetical protein
MRRRTAIPIVFSRKGEGRERLGALSAGSRKRPGNLSGVWKFPRNLFWEAQTISADSASVALDLSAGATEAGIDTLENTDEQEYDSQVCLARWRSGNV